MISLFRALWRLLVGIGEVLRKLAMMVFALVFVVTLVILLRGGPQIEVDDNIALVVAPSGYIVEYDDTDPRERFFGDIMGEPPAVMPIADILDAIDAAAEDPRIALLFLKLDEGFSAGQAQLSEMATAIADFRESGKPVYAWAPFMGQAEFFLAAQADKVFIDPMGAVFVNGFEVDQLYFAEALEALGIEMHVFRQGRYKSAVEPFERSNMSPEARANAKRWLDSIWSQWKERVAAARELTPEHLQKYADELIPNLRAADGDLAKMAADQSMVTQVATLAEVRTAAAEIVGRDPDHGSFRQIWQGEYLLAIDAEPVAPVAVETEAEAAQQRYLALVHVQGEIVDGEGMPGQAGGSLIRGLIEDATRDEQVAGLLLRVDSPGGSVFASEEIRRALEAFQETGRPVVASMGSVAASGGYWVSMTADHIIASASTITGSIGVFGLVPTAEKGFDKLGISADGVGTTVWAGTMNLARPLADHARDALNMVVRHDYRLFVNKVSEGREMTPEAVENVASGQVWSGQQALEWGLVDELGDYAQAVQWLGEATGLGEGARVELFAPAADFQSVLLDHFSSRIRSLLRSEVTALLRGAIGERAASSLRVLAGNVPTLPRRGSVAHCLCDSRDASAVAATLSTGTSPLF